MVLKEDQAKVKALLTEAITVLCKNGLSYRNEFSVEGLLGVTLDNEEVFLISINETIREIGGQNMSPNPPSVQRRSPMPAPQRGQMGKGRGTPPANRARVNQGMQNARKRSLDGEFKNTHPQQGSTPGTPSHPSPHSSMGSPPGTPGTPQQLPGQTDPDQPPIKRLNDDGTQDGDDTLLEDGSANLAKIKSEPGSIPTGDGADWDSTQTDQHDPNNQAMQMPSFGDEFNLQGAMDPAMNVKMEQTGQIPQHSGGAGPGMISRGRGEGAGDLSPDAHSSEQDGGTQPAIGGLKFPINPMRGRGISSSQKSSSAVAPMGPIASMGPASLMASAGLMGSIGNLLVTSQLGGIGRKVVSTSVKHVCSMCGKEFQTPSGLRKHSSLHTGKFSYNCSVCGKGFNEKHLYEGHMNMHQGVAFACIACKRTFGVQSQLVAHQKKCSAMFDQAV